MLSSRNDFPVFPESTALQNLVIFEINNVGDWVDLEFCL